MKHASLFSGIGGFDLAAEWMGWENVFHCEWNPFGQKVLKHYWPKAESFNDITKSDFTKYANQIDILTGGFPCQPYSSAGKRLGKEDERHLWPHMLRAIQEISPRYIVGENVRGLLNWNGGMVFDEVCADLENNGYQVAPVLIPACGVNAPHRRERIWFIAYNNNNGLHGPKDGQSMEQGDERNKERKNEAGQFARCPKKDASFIANAKFESTRSDTRTNHETQGNVWRKNAGDVFGTLCGDGDAIQHAEGIGSQHALENRELEGRRFRKSIERNAWNAFPSQPAVCGGDDGLPTELDGITFSNWRKESVKAYGNAIVPQVAFEIFKAIQMCDDSLL